jgi:hypothetical protein
MMGAVVGQFEGPPPQGLKPVFILLHSMYGLKPVPFKLKQLPEQGAGCIFDASVRLPSPQPHSVAECRFGVCYRISSLSNLQANDVDKTR